MPETRDPRHPSFFLNLKTSHRRRALAGTADPDRGGGAKSGTRTHPANLRYGEQKDGGQSETMV
jgi:hypothetical protein